MRKMYIIKILTCFLLTISFEFISCSQLLNPKTADKEVPESVELSLSGEIYPNRVFLSWRSPSNENFACYELYYDTVPGVEESSILITKNTLKSDTTYIVDGLEQMTTYYFRLFVFNSDTFSTSNELMVTTRQCICGIFTDEIENSMVLIPSGCFFDIDTAPAVLSRSFYMDTSEITEGDWNRYYRFSSDTDTLSQKPKTFVTWYATIVFCNDRSIAHGYDTCYTYSEITEQSGKVTALIDFVVDFTADGFRLPTEDEWEYAYRAGTQTDYFWGKDIEVGDSIIYPITPEDSAEIDSYVWWKHNNTDGMINEVARKKSNPWHLYDMAGNADEMVWNYYSEDRPAFSRFDYTGPEGGITRLVRGGTFSQDVFGITAYSRSDVQPHDDFFNSEKGFRTVRTEVQ